MKVIRLNELLTKFLSRLEPIDRNRVEALDRITIIGCGGVGSWVGIMLSLVLCPNTDLILIDPDKVEPENMNRLPYPLQFFVRKINKAEALAKYIALIRPQVNIMPIAKKYEELDDIEKTEIRKSNVIIEATDSPLSQEKIYKDVEEWKKPVVAGHYDGKHLTVKYHPEGKLDDSWTINYNEGYEIIPSYPTVAILTASLTTELAIHRPREPVLISIDIKP